MLRVHLLGRPRLLLDEIALPIAARPKVVPLLAYVLLHREAPVPRATVASALWPDEPEDDGRTNLRRHLNFLRHLLPDSALEIPWILAGEGGVRWNPAADVWLDCAEFERLAGLPNRLHEALALYAGDLLVERDDEWLDAHRRRLRALYHETLSNQIARARAARDHHTALDAAERLLRDDPWREDTLRHVMLLRYERGDRAGALAEYDRFSRLLREELGGEPMPETTAAYAAIVRDAPQTGMGGGEGRASDGESANTAALPFVGRERELAALHAAFTQAAAGSGTMILVGGEAGAGKSRLAREFAARCEREGALVYRTAATLPEYAPYAPLADMLRAAAPLAASLEIDPVWLSALAALAPDIAVYARELPPLAAVDPSRERIRLFEACSDVWSAIARRRPVVLVIDDVHWAGAGTIALLEHLARRAARARMLLIATYREDELEPSHPLRALRRHVEHDGGGLHVALGRLTQENVAELTRSVVPQHDRADIARAIFERSEGNAFFVEAILREICERGSLADVPEAVRELIAARLALLSEGGRALADVAATIGRAFDIELLRETTGWAQADVLEGLDDLIDRRVIADHGGSRYDYAFNHQLIASVVYDAIEPATRMRRHRRIAQIMAVRHDGTNAQPAEMGLHWERAGEPARAARAYLAAARQACSIYANDDARVYVKHAIALAGDPGVRRDGLLLREQLAAVAGDRAAQFADLVELAGFARAACDRDFTCTVLVRQIELANVTSDRRRERVLIALLDRLVRRSGHQHWAARALEARARYQRATNEFGAARETFAQLLALTEQRGEREAYANARLALADTFIYEGRLDEAKLVLEDLRADVSAAGNQSALVRTLMSFARAALAQQDYATMSTYASEALAIGRAIGDREGEALALHTIANGLVYTYRVGEAHASYRAALELYDRIRHRVGLAGIFVDYGLFHTELGLLDRALEFYARADALADEIGFRFIRAVAAINVSYTQRLRGDLMQAKRAAQRALGLTREIASQHLEAAALGTLGAAECAGGEYAAAIEHLRAGIELRRSAGPSARLGDNLCALAKSYVHAGDSRAADAAAHEMLELYRFNPKLAPQPAEWLETAAEVDYACARPRAALAHLRQARSVVQARAAAIEDAATRAAYLALPFNAAVMASPRKRD